MERNMTNEKVVLNCIMALNDCDMESAIWFVKHNQTCYNIAMAVAQAKDERIKELEVTLKCRSKYERIYRNEFLKTEKQALIDKACEWLEHNVWEYTGFDSYELSEAFKNAMKGDEK